MRQDLGLSWTRRPHTVTESRARLFSSSVAEMQNGLQSYRMKVCLLLCLSTVGAIADTSLKVAAVQFRSSFDVEDGPSTVIVCHDERYPELVRLPAIAGARVVYYISHESDMREENKLPGYRAQMMARAVENGVYVVAANAPGNADLTGSHGQS